jgi:hypothetical protein
LAAFGVELAVGSEQCSCCPSTALIAEEFTMTATITTRPLSDSSDSLLRFGIRVDATACAALGLFVAFAADPLSRLSGLSPTSEWLAGAALVLYGAVLYVLAAAPNIRRIGAGVVVANVVFVIAVVVVLSAGVLPLTGAGVALTLATAAAALGCAYVQYLGVRRLA